jgi:hypothetical protein
MSVDHEINDEHPPAAEDVAASSSGSRWAVAADDWHDLPPELVELLAAPVVVRAEELTGTEDGAGPDHPSPTEPCAMRGGYGEVMPSFLAPVPFGSTALAVAIMPRTRRARRRI